jgi:hypothetical protein
VLAAFLLVFILVDRLSGPRDPDGAPPVAVETTAAPGATSAPTTTRAPTTTAAPTTSKAPTTTAAPTTTRRATTTTAPRRPTRTTEPPLRSAAGVTVQILNGTGELRAARDFKPAVRAEGYRIVNSGNAVGDFPVSTVYYTPGHRADALSFRRRFPAFRNVGPAPGNLSSRVALHVIVGANFDP